MFEQNVTYVDILSELVQDNLDYMNITTEIHNAVFNENALSEGAVKDKLLEIYMRLFVVVEKICTKVYNVIMTAINFLKKAYASFKGQIVISNKLSAELNNYSSKLINFKHAVAAASDSNSHGMSTYDAEEAGVEVIFIGRKVSDLITNNKQSDDTQLADKEIIDAISNILSKNATTIKGISETMKGQIRSGQISDDKLPVFRRTTATAVKVANDTMKISSQLVNIFKN